MKLQDVKALASHDEKFEAVASYTGVPATILRNLWMKESSGGKNTTGKLLKDGERAEGDFQIKPSTKRVWESRTGEKYDAYDFDTGLFLAALTLKENMGATRGNVADALRMYNAGTNRANWNNAETVDYVATIMGGKGRVADAASRYIATGARGDGFLDRSFEEIFYGHSNDPKAPKAPKAPSEKEAIANVVGVVATEQPDQRTLEASNQRVLRENEDIKDTEFRRAQGPIDKLSAVVRDTGVTAGLHRMLDRMQVDQDPDYRKWRDENLHVIIDKAQNSTELNALLNAQSKEELEVIEGQLGRVRDSQKIISAGAGWLPDSIDAALYNLVGGTLGDPVGAGLGFVTAGGFSAAKVGGLTLMAEGRALAGTVSLMGEGALANVGATGLLAAAGETTTMEDLVYSAATGAIMNGALGAGGYGLDKLGEYRAKAKSAKMQAFLNVMEENPHFTPEQAAREVQFREYTNVKSYVDRIEAPAGNQYKLFPTEANDVILNTPEAQKRGQITAQSDTMAGSDRQAMAAEIYAQAERINAAIPTDKKALTNFSGFVPKGQSTAMTLLKSEDPVLQAYAKIALENTTGAGGRQVTASIQSYQHERTLKQHMANYMDFYNEFRKSEGYGLVGEHLGTQEGYKAFNKRVYWAVQEKAAGRAITETNPWVLKGVESVGRGFKAAGEMQHRYKTVGYARIDLSKSDSYMPQRMSVDEIAKLNSKPDVKRAIIDAMSEQFQSLNNFKVNNSAKAVADGKPAVEWKNFDKEFSDDLARKYMERIVQKQYGAQQMPMNISEPWAAEFVEDAMKAMGVPQDQLLDAMGALARGGAGHTKGRLEFDMFREIPDGNGGVMRMGDLFEYDMPSLYHGYVRRVAGESALAQNGIMGSKGLKMIEQAVMNRGLATPQELDAFRQTAAELLNQSFGNRHVWMDNVNMATSAARLGQAAFNQLGEFSAATLALGVSRTINQIPQLGRLWKEVGLKAKGKEAVNPILKNFDEMGDVGLDEYHSSGLFNTRDYEVQVTGGGHTGWISRVLRDANKAQYALSLHRRLVAVQTRGAAEQILDKTMYYVKHGKNDKALTDMGLDDALRARLKANVDKVATFDKKGKLTRLDMHNGDLTADELQAVAAIINRGAGQIIQRTFVGETAPWVHDSMVSMLYKFRSYSLTATEKQWSRNVYNHGYALSFVTLAASMSWALPIYAARVHAKTIGMSEEKAKEYKERWLNPAATARAVMNYSNMTGLAGDVADVGSGFIGAWGGDEAKAFAGAMRGSPRGTQTDDLIGGTLAPPVGLINDVWEGAMGNPAKLFKALPGSNLLFVQPFFNFADSLKDDD